MALENILLRIGGKAASDLRLKQFYALQLVSGTDYGFNLATAATQKPGGILQNKPNTGQAVDAAVLGICKYLAGGTVAVGDSLTPTTTGKLIATTSAKDFVWGRALTAADDGDVATMLVGIAGGRDSGS
jgi:hypothetical protein